MRHGLVIAGKIILWAAVVSWILGFLAVAISLIPGFVDYLEADMEMDGSSFVDVLIVWYIITAVTVSIWASIKGYNIIGSWEKKEVDDEDVDDPVL